jgi:uncharacterized protein (DUF885 family)
MLTLLLQEYIPVTRSGLGVSSLSNGAEYYKACLRWHLSYDMSPEDVHQVGLNEVERIHVEMVKVSLHFQLNTSVLYVDVWVFVIVVS